MNPQDDVNSSQKESTGQGISPMENTGLSETRIRNICRLTALDVPKCSVPRIELLQQLSSWSEEILEVQDIRWHWLQGWLGLNLAFTSQDRSSRGSLLIRPTPVSPFWPAMNTSISSLCQFQYILTFIGFLEDLLNSSLPVLAFSKRDSVSELKRASNSEGKTLNLVTLSAVLKGKERGVVPTPSRWIFRLRL